MSFFNKGLHFRYKKMFVVLANVFGGVLRIFGALFGLGFEYVKGLYNTASAYKKCDGCKCNDVNLFHVLPY